VARLHRPRAAPLPQLETLAVRFAALTDPGAGHGDILADAAFVARALLATPREVVALHGDIHHGNILDFGPRGWFAIDPKGLIGERGFDYANLFCNPDLATATDPERFARRVAIVGEAAKLERRRLLEWVLAWAGLSSVWHREDGTDPAIALAVAQLAAEALAR
jgi:streptomycin 6-kinase